MIWGLLIAAGLAIVNLACLALAMVGLPGTWLMLGTSAIVDYYTRQDFFSTQVLWSAAALAALGELMEFLAGSRGAKKAGAGRRGSLGALFGGIFGAIIGTVVIPVPLVGSLVGAAVGAFGLATLLEHDGGQDLSSAMRAGRGAAKGQITGTFLKLAMGTGVWVLLTVASFWN